MIYQELYDATLAELSACCVNVANFANLPKEFTSGYTHTQDSGYQRDGLKRQAKLVSRIVNPVPQISVATLQQKFKQVMTTYKIYDKLSSPVTATGLFNFFKAVSVFCRDNVHVCCSRLNKSKCIVYIETTNNGYSTLQETDIVKADGGIDVAGTLTNIFTTITPYYVRYNSTLET